MEFFKNLISFQNRFKEVHKDRNILENYCTVISIYNCILYVYSMYVCVDVRVLPVSICV